MVRILIPVLSAFALFACSSYRASADEDGGAGASAPAVAWPTVPSEHDAGFDQRSVTYLSAVRAFEAEPGKDSYDAIGNACIACHQVSCSGVTEFIDSLSWC